MSNRPKILFLPLEFDTWDKARHLGYSTQLALEEGLLQSQVDLTTVPAISLGCAAEMEQGTAPILQMARRMLEEQRFDQVWLELVHSNYDLDFLRWVSTLAPVRVGFVGESLTYSSETYDLHPQLEAREAFVRTRLPFMTHALFWDEADVGIYNGSFGGLRTEWWPQAVPLRVTAKTLPPPDYNCGVFIGALYGERAAWLEHPDLRGILMEGRSAELSTEFPGLFDRLHLNVIHNLKARSMPDRDLLNAYVGSLRSIRRRCFDFWIKTLQEGALVVNLPQFGSGFAGRVVEGMLAGRPVASFAPLSRPRTMELFENGSEILLYSTPDELSSQIRHITSNPKLAQEIASRAQTKVFSKFTIPQSVERILTWTGLGQTSTQAQATASQVEQDQYYVEFFTKHPEWSTPEPNRDESMRWSRIEGFVRQVLGPAGTMPRPRIVEVGCGRGWLTNLLSSYGDCLGVEPVAGVVQAAKRLFPTVRFESGTIDTVLALPDFRPFDLLVSSEVIEHVPKDQQPEFARGIRKLVKPGGYAILTTPRAEALPQWERLAKPSQPIEDWISEDYLQKLFADQGFESLGLQRIYITGPGITYVDYPRPEELQSGELFAIYQVWLFQAPWK